MKKKIYFIGKTKVKDYVVHENIDLVGVLMADGRKEDYTTEQWTNLRSEQQYDDGLMAPRKHEKLMQRMIAEMVGSRVTIGEQSWILEQIANSMGVNYRNAVASMFAVPHTENILLSQIDEILKAGAKKEEPKEEPKEEK